MIAVYFGEGDEPTNINSLINWSTSTSLARSTFNSETLRLTSIWSYSDLPYGLDMIIAPYHENTKICSTSDFLFDNSCLIFSFMPLELRGRSLISLSNFIEVRYCGPCKPKPHEFIKLSRIGHGFSDVSKRPEPCAHVNVGGSHWYYPSGFRCPK